MASIETGIIIAKGVDVGSEINDRITLSGDRGSLAGWENCNVTSTALTIDKSSPDSIQVSGAQNITIMDGESGDSYTKKISITDAGCTISLGSNWVWVGGSQPQITSPSLLVISWDNNKGMAILNTAS